MKHLTHGILKGILDSNQAKHPSKLSYYGLEVLTYGIVTWHMSVNSTEFVAIRYSSLLHKLRKHPY
jgi:hypothetical protein